ncbi:hypothetical protein WJX81_007616 [Elliptochloris bilobata]|uniref:Uncharacterized protein n=1 Tax=Elliptochloris bilobata TaxID=381761 RepID=A0AAW1SI83_9CHLO
MVHGNSAIPYYKPFAERLGIEAANRRLVQAVGAMRPRINNAAPARYSHLADNRKRRSMAEESQRRVEGENLRLLERITALNERRRINPLQRNIAPGVVLDRRLRPVIDTREPAPARSLNARMRRCEAARVAADNGALLDRLVACRGAYSAAAWRAAAREQVRLTAMRSRSHAARQRSSSAPAAVGTALMRTYGIAAPPLPRSATGAGGAAWRIAARHGAKAVQPAPVQQLPQAAATPAGTSAAREHGEARGAGTWAATLLQSSNVTYKYGVSGPFWYASGATIQIILFGILAIEIKRKAPTAHTVLEIINARWGKAAHITFFFFCFATNIIVTAMLILGGASVMNALTGMDIYAAAFLIPAGIILYTVAGGLKATFIASYVHTVIIYFALCIFSLTVYTSSPQLGSPSIVWDHLHLLSSKYPVEGNRDGTYLTFFSIGGFIFGIINIIGNFGTAYWQSAIAAKPSAAHHGYLLGGLMWFCIPFTLATTLGLSALALDLPISIAESNSGLVPPAAALFLLGRGGAILMVIMLFMAVTSSGSAELVAVSSLFTYDVYRTYINPNATGKQIMRISQYIIVISGFFMGVLAIILLKIGLSLGYIYLMMGVLIGSAVVPIAYCMVWSKCTAVGAISGATTGLVAAVCAWLGYTKANYGVVNVTTTGEDMPMLVGNLVAILASALVCTVVSLLKPDNYDWKTTREITMVDDAETGFEAEGPDSVEAMEHAYKFVLRYGSILAVVLIIIWPLLALAAGTFTKPYFYFWVIVSIVWGLIATAICTILPIWESRGGLWTVTKNMVMCRPAVDEKAVAELKADLEKPHMARVPGGNPYATPETSHHGNQELAYNPKLAPKVANGNGKLANGAANGHANSHANSHANGKPAVP